MSKSERVPIDTKKHNIVIAYISAHLIYSNGQRPGTIQYMETNEYQQRVFEDDSEVIVVKRHKTSRSRGPAQIVIETNSFISELLQQYCENIRSTIVGQNNTLQNRFFILHNGGEYRKVYEYMERVAEKFKLLLPAPTTHRKVITTNASENASTETLLNIQDHMSHTKRTSERFYQLRTTKKAIKAQKAIQSITDSRHFTGTQDRQLLHEWPLGQKKTPPLSLRDLISSKYQMDKTPQQIQDHWKALLRKSAFKL